jgi:hypothetical protein
VLLGGSRGRGEARADSDWDLFVYHVGDLDVAEIEALGAADLVPPGTWGPLYDGGGTLNVDGLEVDLSFRRLDIVEDVLFAAEHGAFRVYLAPQSIVGVPSYVLAAELALGEPLFGALPRPEFPPALRDSAARWWHGHAAFSLLIAEDLAAVGDLVGGVGLLAKAVLAEAHARLAASGTWSVNEKGLAGRGGLGDTAATIGGSAVSVGALELAIDDLRERIGGDRAEGLSWMGGEMFDPLDRMPDARPREAVRAGRQGFATDCCKAKEVRFRS